MSRHWLDLGLSRHGLQGTLRLDQHPHQPLREQRRDDRRMGVDGANHRARGAPSGEGHPEYVSSATISCVQWLRVRGRRDEGTGGWGIWANGDDHERLPQATLSSALATRTRMFPSDLIWGVASVHSSQVDDVSNPGLGPTASVGAHGLGAWVTRPGAPWALRSAWRRRRPLELRASATGQYRWFCGGVFGPLMPAGLPSVFLLNRLTSEKGSYSVRKGALLVVGISPRVGCLL